MTAWYNKSDSLPSSPASTAAGLADISPTDSDIDIERYESVTFRANYAASCFPHSLCAMFQTQTPLVHIKKFNDFANFFCVCF